MTINDKIRNRITELNEADICEFNDSLGEYLEDDGEFLIFCDKLIDDTFDETARAIFDDLDKSKCICDCFEAWMYRYNRVKAKYLDEDGDDGKCIVDVVGMK